MEIYVANNRIQTCCYHRAIIARKYRVKTAEFHRECRPNGERDNAPATPLYTFSIPHASHGTPSARIRTVRRTSGLRKSRIRRMICSLSAPGRGGPPRRIPAGPPSGCIPRRASRAGHRHGTGGTGCSAPGTCGQPGC